MAAAQHSLGQAIDKVIEALDGFDEKDSKVILSAACAHFQIPVSFSGAAPGPTASTVQPNFEPRPAETIRPERPFSLSPPIQHPDIRSLRESKQPNSARQMACLVAYYLLEVVPEGERKTEITVEDLDTYFREANYKLPKALEQVLVDSKQAGYFKSGTKRGAYGLTRVGYNLVTHTMGQNKQK